VDQLLLRGEFFTAYTPYQPEISQGTLQALFEWQTFVCLLSGMDVSNASMYDGATATAEAALMATRITGRKKIVVSAALHPEYRKVLATYLRSTHDEVAAVPFGADGRTDLAALGKAVDGDTACVVAGWPNFLGVVEPLPEIAEVARKVGALTVAVTAEAVALGLLQAPGALGADVAVGTFQSFGNPMNFGGPAPGFFATREAMVRQMPGRICGATVDKQGRRGFVLTLSTREQHIRREKATSNICTNSGLCVLSFTIHLSLLGETGLRRLARLNHANAVKLADALGNVPGVSVLNETFFNEFTIRVPGEGAAVIEKLAAKGVLGGVPYSRLAPKAKLDDLIVVASTEVNTDEDRTAYARALAEAVS
jgi:glycine dehydrogenase subunit 1